MIILNSLLLLLLLFVFIIQSKRQSHLCAKSPVHVYLYSIGRFESCSVLMWSMYKSITVKRLAKINCRSFKRNKANRFPLFYGSWGDPVYCSLTNWHNKSVKTAVATCNKKPPWWEVYRHVIRQSLNENKNQFSNEYIYIYIYPDWCIPIITLSITCICGKASVQRRGRNVNYEVLAKNYITQSIVLYGKQDEEHPYIHANTHTINLAVLC